MAKFRSQSMIKLTVRSVAILRCIVLFQLITATFLRAQTLPENEFPIYGNTPVESVDSSRVLPPLDSHENENSLSNQPRIWVNSIHLEGNTIFTDEDLSDITDNYENKEITTQQLQQLRRQLTLHYIKNGYISSGAVIPDQEVGDGEITLKIIEGKLSDIHIENFQSLRIKSKYLTKRIALNNQGPLNLNKLQERLQLLHQNSQIQKLQTELTPGARPGESILNVKATEPERHQFGISVNNGRSPSVGEFRLEAWLSDNNLTRNGDSLSLQLGTTEGLNDATLLYAIPISARDAILSISVSRSESEIIEEPFDQINITSQTDSASIKYEHPVFQSLDGYFKLSLGLDKRKSISLLDGDPFEFSPGAKNGIAKVTVIRIGQSWLKKTPNRVFALNTRFSIGLDELGATKNSAESPDGGFLNFFGQAQWIQRLNNFDLVLRAETQLSDDPLLSLEKFGLGGSRSIRGYRENLFVRDQGWLGSIEARIPIKSEKLKLAVFYEGGAAENLGEQSASETLASTGLGILWNPSPRLQTQGYWGYALKKVDLGSNSHLQDDGFHFTVDYQF